MIKKISCSIVCLSLLLSGCGNGSGNTTSNNISPKLNSMLNQFIESYGNTYSFSAMSTTVKCGNLQTVSGIAGTFESTGNVSINTNSLFQIGSTSKSFTSVVILQLADDKNYNFSLNDTLSKWFKNVDGSPTYPMWESVTVTQLLNMSSGIPDYFNDNPNILISSITNPNRYFSPTELVSSVTAMPVLFAAGHGFNYSNTNYVLLGMLIQQVTGNNPIFEIQTRIFNKLGLHNTYFPSNLPATVVPTNQMVNGYGNISFLPSPYVSLNGFYNFTWNSLSIYYTAGGIISTPQDLMTYTNALFTPGKLLTSTEIDEFISSNMVSQNPTPGYPNGGQPITSVSESIPVGFGLGVFNIYSSESLGSYYMYNGATMGYGSYYAYYPKNNMYLTLMINNGINIGLSNPNYQNLINQIVQYTITTQCMAK